MIHVVVFPGWYPNKFDKLSGDFIQRHLHAIAAYCKVTVIIPVKENNTGSTQTIVQKTGSLTEIYCYYRSVKGLSWLNGALSFLRYNAICISKAKAIAKRDKIHLVHLCVLQKNQLLGVWLRRLLKVPYVITEHSTLYVDGGFERLNKVKQSLWRYAFAHADGYHAVSAFLARQIKQKLRLKEEAVVIPNVVNTKLFRYAQRSTAGKTSFVHVSSMAAQKNVQGMLSAFAEVKKVNAQFRLTLVGQLPASVAALIKLLDLEDEVVIKNEQSYEAVAEIMQQNDALVLFTCYETFGCVIIEANACGVPVIVSDLEVLKELVTDGINGFLVKKDDINALAEKILLVMNNKTLFDAAAISAKTSAKFNYQIIGKQFAEWYERITVISSRHSK